MTLAPLPLDGVRVIDFTRVLAGPYCSLMLADMGADVIKIENPDGGDDTRRFSEPSHHGHSVYFLTANRNKRSLALDLKAPAGRDILLKLIGEADVVLENFRTGVMERLGLGYDTLKAVRPSLVYCAISGYGRSGPNVNVPGYDPVSQAETGLMSMIGEPDGQPMRTGPSLVDLCTGLYASQAICAALRQAERTGEGRFIETTLHETGLNMLANFAGNFLMTGNNPTRSGNTNQLVQPAGVYEAADGPFMLAVATDAQFRRLCIEVVGQPALADDPRFRENPLRVRNGEAIRSIFGAAFAAGNRADWVEKLRAVGVPAGVISTVAEALTSDLVAARDTVRDVQHAEMGTYPVLETPARLHDTAAVPARGAPLLGEHSAEILRDLAGLSDADIASLEADGVIRTATG